MQKKIIAVAVAALASTAAFAQTNVTVYGVVDVQQAFVKSSSAAYGGNTQQNVGRLDAHGNYIGFKGVEDLGNGLKAVFVYESAFGTDTGAGLTGTRDSYIGLAGGFGTVAAGRLTHPLRAFGAKVELLPGAAGFGTTASVTGTIAGLKTGADDRADNAIAYISPSFSGVTVIAAYVNGENRTNAANATPNVNNRQWQIAAQYENGPLFAGIGYHRDHDYAATVTDGGAPGQPAYTATLGAADGGKASVIRAVGVYTFPSNTKVTALFDRTKADSNIGELKRNAFSLGVAQGFGKNTVGLEYGRAFKLKAAGSAVEETSANIVSAIYSYDLSKRTMLHARYSRLSNGDAVNNNFYNKDVNNGEATGTGANYTGFSVGLRHSF
ncbi:porin [Quatrionicoccus australiensis]|uniref:porin n=1 Tax=Quatrionicoccus australiensis TaxID=138118 RepID=UPI001CFB9884|nr:porin [Quatrionicoccus australiensis]MCB4359371.1 porin [Quatrionicoccus australiensis]